MDEEKKELELMVNEAKEITINNQDDYTKAVDFLKQLKEYRKKLDARYVPVQEATKKANQIALKNINDYKIPIEKARDKIRNGMSTYTMRIEQESRAEENRLRREAEEKERAKIQAELQEVGYKKAEAKKESEQIIINIPEITIKEEPNPKGISYRENWDFEVVDDSKIPAQYLVIDGVKIGKVVRAMKKNTNIPGIKVFCKKTPIERF